MSDHSHAEQHAHGHDDGCGDPSHDHGHHEGKPDHGHGHEHGHAEHGHAEHEHAEPVPLLDALLAKAPAEEELPELSWRVVSMIYAAGTALCVTFGVLHYVLEFNTVKGFWLIFVVFPPSLVYALVKWKAQRERHALEAKQAKKD